MRNRSSLRSSFLVLALMASGLLSTSEAQTVATGIDGPLVPAEALKSFKVEPGLKLELVAAEPLIVSPCAVCWDERGRMFVAENRGYPTGPKEGESPVGRIVQLIDKDGDGRMDERVDFATELSFPNGVMPWRGGLIVTCSPDVLFLKDTDGDGKADDKRVLLTGFDTKGSTQLRTSHPMLGLDGWVYLTSGLTGGKVISPLKPEQTPVEVKRTDIRFKPDTGEIEACDGGAQFGQTFDDFGRRFICYNRVQIQHVVLPSKYLKRNPHLAFAETVENCPAELADEPLKGHGRAARIFPISNNMTTADSHAGTFTAACAVTIFRGTGLPQNYYGTAFSCDPTGNLVHCDKLEPRGATFAARSMFPGREVLASTDNWFRPVFLANAPDGALYVCDMYRQTIEHPDYLPVEIRKRTDFEGGKTMGRIYRLKSSNAGDGWTWNRLFGPNVFDLPTYPQPVNDLTSLRFPQLASTLRTPNCWQRETAFRLLLESRDERCRRGLPFLLPTAAAPARQSALHLLNVLGYLDDDLLIELGTGKLSDRSSWSSRNGDITFPQLIASRSSLSPELVDALLKFNSHHLNEVHWHAIALGNVKDPRALEVLAEIATRPGSDRWIRAAVLSSIAGREDAFLDELMANARGIGFQPVEQTTKPSPKEAQERQAGSLSHDAGSDLFYDFGRLLGASKTLAESRTLMLKITTSWKTPKFEHQVPLLTGLADGLRARGLSKANQSLVETLLDDAPETERASLDSALEPLAVSAAQKVEDSQATVETRRRAIDFLAHAGATKALPFLSKLVSSQQPEPVQSSAIKGLIGLADEHVAETLLTHERFQSYTPRLREEIIGSLASTPRHVPGFLTAIEAGIVPPAAIDTLRRRQLALHKDPAVRERATKIFGAGPSGDRAKVYEEHKPVLSLTSNAENGRQVFKRACANCHRLDREGTPVGPDLFGIRNQPKEAILLHILVPEHEITPGFTAYIVTTKEGRVLTGLISSETSTSLTLKQALGKEETILRQDIEELLSSKLSLMPQGVEKTVNKQEFADLLSYLKGEK